MKRMTALILVIIISLTVLAACGKKIQEENSTGEETYSDTLMQNDGVVSEESSDRKSEDSTETPVTENIAVTDSDMFSSRDYRTEYDAEEAVTIKLTGDSAASSSDSVKIADGKVVISEEAVYKVSGVLEDGMIVIASDDKAKIQLVFEGAEINCETSAPLYIKEADKVFITLAEGTENSLTNGGEFISIDENNIDAALFSKQDLTINGNGSLTVTSPAGHGITCKDDLVFTGGTCSISAANHGIDVNDSFRMTGETDITVDAGKDGIHSENSDDSSLGFVYAEGGRVKIEAEGDGIAAGAHVQINGGSFELLSGGGYENGTKSSSDFYGGFNGGRPGGFGQDSSEDDENSVSMKGIKAVAYILINGGVFTIDSADDSIHSDTSVELNGGSFTVSSGDDAFHGEDSITVNSCSINVEESYEGIEAEKIYINAGNIVLNSSDDGINASGGRDSSGMSSGRDGMFGGPGGHEEPGGMGGFGGMSGSSTGVIEICGGDLKIYSSGDGMDSNGSLIISGGYIYVANPTSGDTSVLDSDIEPVIDGGTFISTGSTTMMAQTFSSTSKQGVISCTVGNQKAGQTVSVTDDNGKNIITYETEYQCVLVIISSSDIIKGNSYKLSVGDISGDVTAN